MPVMTRETTLRRTNEMIMVHSISLIQQGGTRAHSSCRIALCIFNNHCVFIWLCVGHRLPKLKIRVRDSLCI